VSLKYLIKKFDLIADELEPSKYTPKMKVKTNHELFFEFQTEFRTLAHFPKTRTAERLLLDIEFIAKSYVKKYQAVFIESDTLRTSFDKMLRNIKHPYFWAIYDDQNKKTGYDKMAVHRNLLNSLSECIIELDITITDKQTAILEVQKIYAFNAPNLKLDL